MLVPDHRGGVLRRAAGRLPGLRIEDGPGRAAAAEPIAARPVPYKSKTGWVYDSGDYEATMRLAMDMIGYAQLRAEQAEKRKRGELMGIGISFFTEAVGAGPRWTWTSSASAWPTAASSGSTDRQKRCFGFRCRPRAGARDDLRADRRREAWYPARGHRRRTRRHRPDAVRSGYLRQPLDAGIRCAAALVARKIATRPGTSPPACWRPRLPTWNGRRAVPREG